MPMTILRTQAQLDAENAIARRIEKEYDDVLLHHQPMSIPVRQIVVRRSTDKVIGFAEITTRSYTMGDMDTMGAHPGVIYPCKRWRAFENWRPGESVMFFVRDALDHLYGMAFDGTNYDGIKEDGGRRDRGYATDIERCFLLRRHRFTLLEQPDLFKDRRWPTLRRT